MKNTIKILSISIILVLSSCEKYLDLTPISQIGENGFYTNATELEVAVVGIYDALQKLPLREFAVTEMRSDNARARLTEGEFAQFITFDVLPTNSTVSQYWIDAYAVIFRANTVLAHLDVITNPVLKAQYEGEAKFARALSYFNMVRLFGEIPIVDKIITQYDDAYFNKKSISEVYALINIDLSTAIAGLPAKGKLVVGRATPNAARAILAKVKLTQGQYAEAKSLLDQIIASKEYSLSAEFNDIFYKEQGPEIIFATQYVNDNVLESQDFSTEFTTLGRGSGLNYASASLTASFSAADAKRKTTTFNPANPLQVGKFITSSKSSILCGNDWIVIRYADILLMQAEAILGANASTTDLAALTAINAVRSRAGLPNVETLTKEQLLLERRLEFAFENQRLFDIIRFGSAKSILSEYATSNKLNFTEKSLLLPIPQREIDISRGLLTQNTGY